MSDVQPGDRYCSICGQALNVLSRCPSGCDAWAATPDEIMPDLRLVDEDEEPFELDEPDEEGRGW